MRLYARFYICLITVLIIVMLLLLKLDNNNTHLICISEIVLLLLDLIQPFVMFRALQQDSLYWQGLYDRTPNAINSPLLGIWDLGRETIGMVTESITDLEQKIVKIIPYGAITLDTRL